MIKFAGKALPDYIKVTNIKYSILPSIDNKTETVYGRAGSYDFGIEVGERKVEVDLMIIADNQNDIIRKARDFATWLFYRDLQPLILLDEPDKQYMARVVGDSEVSELYRTGSATITFSCPDAYAESTVEKVVNYSPTDYTPVNIQNNGSVETYPTVDLTLKQSATSIALVLEDKYVKIGNEEVVDKTKVAIDPIVLNDPLDTYSGWGTGLNVDGGAIAGALASNGGSLFQQGYDFGSGTQWHGGAGLKTLSRPLTNFKVDTKLIFNASSVKQVGRIEVYLYDINNVVIGKIALVDNAKDGTYPRAEARAGALSGGKYFVNSYGDKKGVFQDFSGIMTISRTGRVWTAYFAKIDSKGKHNTRLYKTWYDSKGTFSDKQLAKIQVHIGAYGDNPAIATMYLSDIKVYEKTASSVNLDTQIPIIFNAGDTVTIDNKRAIVLQNGEPIFTALDPNSDFFALNQGANGILLSPPIADVSIRYKERWL